MNKTLFFIYEPNGLLNAQMKLAHNRRGRITEQSFTYFSLDDFDARTLVPDMVILEDEAFYQMELVEAAFSIDELNSILICDNLGTLNGLIDKLTIDPLIITLDYKIGSNNSPENLPVIYHRLRERFRTSAIMGFTNFGRKKADKEFSARSADELTNLIRANSDSVIEKSGMSTQGLNSTLWDRIQMHAMRKQLAYLTLENSSLKKGNEKQQELYADKLRAYRESVTMRNLERPMIGNSPAMRKIKFYTEHYADSDLEVLLLGEMGTGKEVIARALHRLNPRRCRKEFVPVDCGAFNKGTVEGDLFGYEEGAYTGAAKLHIGYVEQANKGTLFLDEIGNLPYELQVKLLRVLQEREIVRLSGKRISIDFRLICASNKDLRKMVAEGSFHADLLERIDSYFPEIPPLRERKEDIPLLITFFIKKNSFKFKLSEQAIAYLSEQEWPGNVRNLEKFMRHLAPFHKEETLDLSEVRQIYESKMKTSKEKEIPFQQEALHLLDKVDRILGTHPKFTQAKKINLDDLAAELGISRMSFFEQRKKLSMALTKALTDDPKNWPSIGNKKIKLTIPVKK